MSVESDMRYLIRKARIAKAFGDHELMHIYNTVESVASSMIRSLEFHAAGEITDQEYRAEKEKTIDLTKLLGSYMEHYICGKLSGFG